MITCVSTFKAVDVSVPLRQMGQVNWQVIMHQLHHIAYEKKAGRTREGRRRGAGKELIEMLQQSRVNCWMKELRKTRVKQMLSGVLVVHVLKICPVHLSLYFHEVKILSCTTSVVKYTYKENK